MTDQDEPSGPSETKLLSTFYDEPTGDVLAGLRAVDSAAYNRGVADERARSVAVEKLTKLVETLSDMARSCSQTDSDWGSGLAEAAEMLDSLILDVERADPQTSGGEG